MKISHLEPLAVWRHFEALCACPRVSGREGRARQYVVDQARAAGARTAVDGFGNVVVSAQGVSAAEPVAIQAHLDMVPGAREGVMHDWASAPIVPILDGAVVRAQGTTLGADNGIGVALALASITDGPKRQLPLQLIFTVEEEIGLRGASRLDPALIRARQMINLDSEEVDKLTVGCAGGSTIRLTVPLTLEAVSVGWTAFALSAAGGKGGHTGLEIHRPRVNAIKQLAGAIAALRAQGIRLRIAAFSGGTAPNAIPGSAAATIVVASSDASAVSEAWSAEAAAARARWTSDEPDFGLALQQSAVPSLALSEEAGADLLALVAELPHGVQRMSDVHAGKVETSANVAQFVFDKSAASVIASARSFLPDALTSASARIRDVGAAHGASSETVAAYPGWPPQEGSKLVAQTADAFRSVYHSEPEIEVVHAGLECGAIISRIPDLDAVSFGPDIRGAHTPDEQVTIATVRSTWAVLNALLDRLEQAGQTS